MRRQGYIWGIVLLALSSCLPVFGSLEIQPASLKVVQIKELNFYSRYAENVESPILQVNISSNTDMYKLLKNKNLFIFNNTMVSCNKNSNLVFETYLGLSAREKGVTINEDSPFVNTTAPYFYQIYISIFNKMQINPMVSKYNLWKKPEDICFMIQSHDPTTIFGITSNTIRIPKEAIKAALDDYRKAHPDFVPPEEP